MNRILSRFFTLLLATGVTACAAATVESPVQAATRSSETLAGQFGDSYMRQADGGSVVAKVFAPAPQVWGALVAAMETRGVKPTIVSRAAGRIGDTSLVMMRQWNGRHVSHVFNCGSSMTGQRANEDRIKSVFLAQISRGTADTVGISVHLSGVAVPVTSGASGTPAQCQSTGRGEAEFLDDVLGQMGRTRTR